VASQNPQCETQLREKYGRPHPRHSPLRLPVDAYGIGAISQSGRRRTPRGAARGAKKTACSTRNRSGGGSSMSSARRSQNSKAGVKNYGAYLQLHSYECARRSGFANPESFSTLSTDLAAMRLCTRTSSSDEQACMLGPGVWRSARNAHARASDAMVS